MPLLGLLLSERLFNYKIDDTKGNDGYVMLSIYTIGLTYR